MMHLHRCASAFCVPGLPLQRIRTIWNKIPSPRCCTTSPEHSRRIFVGNACLALAGITLHQVVPTEAAEKLSKLESAVVPVVMCRKVMKPVARYIEEGSWDKGRTNVNYCTRVLALRSHMRQAAEELGGDEFYEGMDIMGEIVNTMTQLDASLYTPLFIASDEGISFEQRKYQTEARAYYKEALEDLDRFLSIVPTDSLERAKKVADEARYEIRVDRE